jgi:acyl carrier protein
MPATPSLDELRTWLTQRVGEYLDGTVAHIRTDVALVEYGLDSMYALIMCGEIEDHLGLTVEPTLAWDYDTIDAVAGFLTRELAGGRAEVASRPGGAP